jgi:hypothetical protein
MSLFIRELKEELNSFFRIQKNFEQLENFKGPNKCFTLSWISNELENCKDWKLYCLYKSQFSLFLKKNFDCFGRGPKVYICKETRKIFDNQNKNLRIESSLCQLNYLRFVIESDVINKLKDLKIKEDVFKPHKYRITI